LKNLNLGNLRKFRSPKSGVNGALGTESPQSLAIFEKYVIKITHFRHNSAKLQPKNLKLVHYWFLIVRDNIRLGRPAPEPPLATPLRKCIQPNVLFGWTHWRLELLS